MNLAANKGMFLEKILDNTVTFYQDKPYFFFLKYHTKNAITKSKKFLYIQNDFVDYFGYYKKHFFVIEAKQNATNRFSLERLNINQWFVLQKLSIMDVKTYVAIYFVKQDEFFLVPFSLLVEAKENNQKSIKYEDIKKGSLSLEPILPGILNLKIVFDQNW